MTQRFAAQPHALRSDLTDCLGGGLVDPQTTSDRLAGLLGGGGRAVFVHRDRKAALRWLRRTGLAPGRPLDPVALSTPPAARRVVLFAPDGHVAPLMTWWQSCAADPPTRTGRGLALGGHPPASSWALWRHDTRCALAFHADDRGLRIGVLLLEGLGAEAFLDLQDHAAAMTASVVRQYWLTWRSRSKETLDAIAAEHVPVHLSASAASNHTALMTRVAQVSDELLAGVAAALQAPVAMLALPDTTWTHIGRIGQVGFRHRGRPHSLGPAERGLSLRFCYTPARVPDEGGVRALGIPDGDAMVEAYRRFAITAPDCPSGPVGTPAQATPVDREAGFYPSDASLDPALGGGPPSAPRPRLGPWAYAAVPLDPWLWSQPAPQQRLPVPHDARRHYGLATGDPCGVLKVQGRLGCALLDPPGAPPAPFAAEELRALALWAPELGRILQRRIRQEEQALSDRLFELAASALVHGGLHRLVELLRSFTQAQATALLRQAPGAEPVDVLSRSWAPDISDPERAALSTALVDPSPSGPLGEAWLLDARVVVGTLPDAQGGAVTFLKQPVTASGTRRLALVFAGVPAELQGTEGPAPFPGVLRPALTRVARLLHATLMYQDAATSPDALAPADPAAAPPQPSVDYEAFATAWRTLLTRRMTVRDQPTSDTQQGLWRFARDVAASFGQQGELARVLGVESQTVRRHMVTIVPDQAAPPWRALASEGAVLQVSVLTRVARDLAQEV